MAIVVCLVCSCTNDDIIPEPSTARTEQPEHAGSNQQDSCDIDNGIDVGGEDFDFDNDNPPTGIITPTI